MPLLLILDSLGTSEFLLILVVAMIFFGPRKLPQISRQIGKSLAEFRKASDDFKRTWAREVALETDDQPERPLWPRDESNFGTTVERSEAVQSTTAEGETPAPFETLPETQIATNEPATISPVSTPAQPEPSRKRDWL
jgi:sec-independent protein translocase protein TatB